MALCPDGEAGKAVEAGRNLARKHGVGFFDPNGRDCRDAHGPTSIGRLSEVRHIEQRPHLAHQGHHGGSSASSSSLAA